MINVIATIRLRPDTRELFLAEFSKVMPKVHEEDGCLEYQAAIDVLTDIPPQTSPEPDEVVVIEKWLSVEHLKIHLQAPHMAEYRTRVKDYVETVRLRLLEPFKSDVLEK